jgi:Gpi18-like mannosyltransferase
LFSYFDFNTLYLIKLLSVFFDIGACFCLNENRLPVFTDSPLRKALCFICALALPTVVINGSVWGQCDSNMLPLR